MSRAGSAGRRRLLLLGIAAVVAIGPGCGGGEPPVPEGVRLWGDAPAAVRFLDELATLQGTPAARIASDARGRLAGCTGFEAQIPADQPLTALMEALQCSEPSGDAVHLEVNRPGEASLRGTLREGPSGPVLSLRLRPESASGVLGALLPAGDPPGAPVLRTEGSLLHARWRTEGGLDVASMVEQGSEADRMLGLKADLLSAAVLAGSWEIAAYEVPDGWPLPPLAAALDHRLRGPAEAALDQLVGQLETTWGVQRTSASTDAGEAVCLPSIQVMPAFAPCGVVTERAVVVGWNLATLRGALGDGTGAAPTTSRATISLAALPASDARLAAARAAAAGAPDADPGAPVEWPWSAATLEGSRDGDAYLLELRLTR